MNCSAKLIGIGASGAASAFAITVCLASTQASAADNAQSAAASDIGSFSEVVIDLPFDLGTLRHKGGKDMRFGHPERIPTAKS